MLSVSYFPYCVLTFLTLLHQTHGQTCEPDVDYTCVNETSWVFCLEGTVAGDALQCPYGLYCEDGCQDYCKEKNRSCVPVITITTIYTPSSTTTELTTMPISKATETTTELPTEETSKTETTTTEFATTTMLTTRNNTELITEETSAPQITTSMPSTITEITTELNTEESSRLPTVAESTTELSTEETRITDTTTTELAATTMVTGGTTTELLTEETKSTEAATPELATTTALTPEFTTEIITVETSTPQTTTTSMPPATTELTTELNIEESSAPQTTSVLTVTTTTTDISTELNTEEITTTGLTITSTPTTKTTTELPTEHTIVTELTTTKTEQTRPPTVATTPLTTSSVLTDAPTTVAPFKCESAGEFQDIGDCKNFYLCIPLSSGDFVYIKFSCPDGSQFDSVTKKCSQNATCIRPSCNEFGFYCISTSQVQLCYDSEPPSGDAFTCPANTYCSMDCQYPCWADIPCTVPTESPSISTTTLLTSTVTLPWTTSESPMTSTTAFPTSTVTLPPTTTDYSTTTTTLPTSTVTSPPTTTESSSTSTTALPTSTVTVPPTTTEYPSTSTTALPTSTVTSPPSTTESSTTTSPTSTVTLPQTTTAAPFICLETGKFPDPTNCSRYYVCSPKSSGGFYTLQFSCPASSLFNPSTKQCSSSFTCPNTGLTGTSNSTESLVVTTTSRPFTCEEPGRFADPVDCKSYYVCSPKSSGGFYELHYQCPSTSAFNPTTRQCSKNASVNCAAA
uniref:Insect intestinal mucin 3 n=1 Tax=Locusta migratoria TaxID=7004 RepID=A0A7D4X736_LOCMI|nr:insect intestinal mucin 3 [Locusta migratoria]